MEEQPKEIEDCLKYENKLPANLLLDELSANNLSKMTAVHCTYTTRENLDRFSKLGCQICICPLTEGNKNLRN